MATFNKFNAFYENLAEGVHNLGANTLKVMLTNTAPVAANSVKADLTEIAAGNGYVAGGFALTVTGSAQSGGVYSLTVADATPLFTATGAVGPFRYVVLYNDTPTSPADPLIGWWDYGSSVSLATGEPLNFDVSDAGGLIFQIA